MLLFAPSQTRLMFQFSANAQVLFRVNSWVRLLSFSSRQSAGHDVAVVPLALPPRAADGAVP